MKGTISNIIFDKEFEIHVDEIPYTPTKRTYSAWERGNLKYGDKVTVKKSHSNKYNIIKLN